MQSNDFRKTNLFRLMCGWIIFGLVTSIIPPQSYAQIFDLPTPGTMIQASPAFIPVLIKGLKVYPDNPLLFDFILDIGKSAMKVTSPEFKVESEKLIKYFLAALTIKEDDLWVNLSPYEKDRIITEGLGKTELGRDMLAQDYILKQLIASLLCPEKNIGQAFWRTIYAEAQAKFGTTNIPVDTLNKVWIVADKAKVLERNNAAYVVGAHFKVMLESDYFAEGKTKALEENVQSEDFVISDSRELAKQVLREVIVPAIEKEVNEGKNFAMLRQMFYSMILASWYKLALKNVLLNQVYSNKAKIAGIESVDPKAKEKIYEQYLAAYRKGVFNFIKEESDIQSGETIPRKYFSGGIRTVLPSDIDRVRITTEKEEADMAQDKVNVVSVLMESIVLVTDDIEGTNRTGLLEIFNEVGSHKFLDERWREAFIKQYLSGMPNEIASIVDAFYAYRLADAIEQLGIYVAKTTAGDRVGILKEFAYKQYAEDKSWNQSDVPLEEQTYLFRAIEHELNIIMAAGRRHQSGTIKIRDPFLDKKLPAIVNGAKLFQDIISRLILADGIDEYIELQDIILNGNRNDDHSRSPQGEVESSKLLVDDREALKRIINDSSVQKIAISLDNVGSETYSILLEALLLSRMGKQVTLYVKREPTLFSDVTLDDLEVSIKIFDKIWEQSKGSRGPLEELQRAQKLIIEVLPYEYLPEAGKKKIEVDWEFLAQYDVVILEGELQYGDFMRHQSRRLYEEIEIGRGVSGFNPFQKTVVVLRKTNKNNREQTFGVTLQDYHNGQETRGEGVIQVLFPDREEIEKLESTTLYRRVKSLLEGATGYLAQYTNGGIELNVNRAGLDVTKDGNGIHMNVDPAVVAEFERGDFSGIRFRVISITPAIASNII